jgi:hypothetical protein
LPCHCGQAVVVEPRQAGQTAVCSCGASLPIPTMLEIVALEPATVDSSLPQSESAWEWHQRLLLLGISLLLLATVIGIWGLSTRPVAPIDMVDTEKLRQSAKDLPPVLTWHFWTLMRQGLDRRVDPKYMSDLTIYHLKLEAAGIVALGGLVLAGIGLAMRKRPKEPQSSLA